MGLEALKQLPPWVRELLSAVAVVLAVFLLAWGYTGNWPPMVVIESGSMEHDDNPLYPEPGFTHIGAIDTGDLVLVKSAERDDIVTYLEGKQTGYKRYGDYGDVIIYYKNGVRGGCDMNMTSKVDFDISITAEAECNRQDGEWVVLRVPYPLGFYTKWMDGRIDDADAGWKGRGVWATYSTRAPFHLETGKGTSSKVVHFQLRPDPLAR